MIRSINLVEILEINGTDFSKIPDGERPDRQLTVESHWNYDSLVVLQHGASGEKIAVNAGDLITAITNARNSHRHGC
jgi:hypothetical protein